uniref:Uncharacterized protein n=1 Tax=Triticum urartu TaxID=4572 RepID=A0A8R7QB62_TRIUA
RSIICRRILSSASVTARTGRPLCPSSGHSRSPSPERPRQKVHKAMVGCAGDGVGAHNSDVNLTAGC